MYEPAKIQDKRFHLALLISFCLVFLWSAIKPYDIKTWFFEVGPLVIGVIAIIAYYQKFRLSNLAYLLIWLDVIIILIGGHYTYPQVPIFDWLKDTLALSRNHYDRFGHFFQGVMPAILIREVLLRKFPISRGIKLNVLVVAICLGISAAYELLEFAAAKLFGGLADKFLGTQGDIWDTQWDMFWALLGAVIALSVLSKIHDRSLQKLLTTSRINGYP